MNREDEEKMKVTLVPKQSQTTKKIDMKVIFQKAVKQNGEALKRLSKN